MLKQLCLWVLVLFSPFAAWATGEAFKMGYIDMNKAIQTTSTGKEAKSKLEKEFEAKKKEIKKKEDDLKKMKDDIDKKKLILSDSDRQQKMANFEEEVVKYRDMVAKSQMDMQKKERELTEPILEKFKGTIGDLAKSEGYSVIVEKQSVLWAKEDLDLTDKVIKLYESKAKK